MRAVRHVATPLFRLAHEVWRPCDNTAMELELDHFYNHGFGWVCRRCEGGSGEAGPDRKHARFYLEGEAESKSPSLTNSAIAKWADPAQTILICPRCGLTEQVDKR